MAEIKEPRSDFNSFLFRASSAGNILVDERGGTITEKQIQKLDELLKKQNVKPLTANQVIEVAELLEKREKEFDLSKTTKGYLLECWIEARYKRRKDIETDQMLKGKLCEESALTLYSRLKKRYYEKNKQRIFNGFITGEPDFFEGPELKRATAIVDIKNAFDIHTYFDAIVEKISKIYEVQLQCYGDLTGAEELRLARCLIDMPEVMLQDKELKLFYQMQKQDDGPATRENPEYLLACQELRKKYTYPDMEMHEKMHERSLVRDPKLIQELYRRIPLCRQWMNDLYTTLYPKLLKAA
jgi:hypothetical protein